MYDRIANILEKRGVIQILLYLKSSEKGIQKIDFRRELELTPSTAVRAQKHLFKYRIIENVPYSDLSLIQLSDLGKKIAERLQEIDEIIDTSNMEDFIYQK